MTSLEQPQLVPTEDLESHFRSRGIAYSAEDRLGLGFGEGNDQYRLYSYPAPADDETMGLFCEWHTEDFFEVDSGPHVAIGLRGPVEEDPHRGRGLAIGILANRVNNPEDPENPIPLFRGCPDPPGGPSFFVEDFTQNDGVAPISKWQLSDGRHLPRLQANGIFRIDIHVSCGCVWAAVWKVTITRSADVASQRHYCFLGQVSCTVDAPGFSGNPASPCPENEHDKGRGNAFIGSGFADPGTRSWVDNIYIAHWKNSGRN